MKKNWKILGKMLEKLFLTQNQRNLNQKPKLKSKEKVRKTKIVNLPKMMKKVMSKLRENQYPIKKSK